MPTTDLCLANVDGSEARVIVEVDNTSGIQSATWSPDGSRPAFWDSGPQVVRIVDVETGETTRRVGRVGWLGWLTWLDDHILIVDQYSFPH